MVFSSVSSSSSSTFEMVPKIEMEKNSSIITRASVCPNGSEREIISRQKVKYLIKMMSISICQVVHVFLLHSFFSLGRSQREASLPLQITPNANQSKYNNVWNDFIVYDSDSLCVHSTIERNSKRKQEGKKDPKTK